MNSVVNIIYCADNLTNSSIIVLFEAFEFQALGIGLSSL